MLERNRGVESPVVGEVYTCLTEYARSKSLPLKKLGMEPEDFVQDVFAILWSRTNQLQSLREDLRNFVVVAAKRRLIDLIRRSNRRQKFVEGDVYDYTDVPASSDLDPYIFRMLESLPEDSVSVSWKISCGWRSFLGAWAEGDAEGVMEKFSISRATAYRLREELLTKLNYGC